MATAAVTYTFTALTKAQAAQVNQNFTNLTTFLNADVVHVDGSKSMTGALTLPASNPTNDNHAARKKYVDDLHTPTGWGLVGYAAVTASQNGITTRADLTSLSVTWTAVANRRYRTTFSGEVNGTVANDLLIAYICNGANTELKRGVVSVGGVTGGTGYNTMTLQFVTTPGAGSVTHKVRLERNAGTGTANLFASAASPAFILVEDIGPA